MADTLQVTYTGGFDSSVYEPFIYLVQDDVSHLSAEPTAGDLEALLNFIISGKSARTYNTGDCPLVFSGDRIYLTLDFFVHVSSEHTNYVLSTTKGEILEPVEESGEEDQYIIIPMADHIDLERNVTNVTSFSFETACYNSQGEIIPVPDYEIVGSRIVFTEELFAVARVAYQYLAYRYTISIYAEYDGDSIAEDPQTGEYKTLRELAAEGVYGYIIVDWETTISADYTHRNGNEGTLTLKLDIPGCVNNMVGTCIYPTVDLTSVIIDPPKDDSDKIVVYYNNCDGTFIRSEFP